MGVRTPAERLRAAADLFEERNAAYGENYTMMGGVMAAMYPQGLTVRTPEEWTRLMLQVHRVTKETRYSQNFGRGGHQDSLDDLSVYAMMAAEQDEVAGEPLRWSSQVHPMVQPPPPTTHILPQRRRGGKNAPAGVSEKVYTEGWGAEGPKDGDVVVLNGEEMVWDSAINNWKPLVLDDTPVVFQPAPAPTSTAGTMYVGDLRAQIHGADSALATLQGAVEATEERDQDESPL